jgi:DNA invertase Pin-like site-specific DNA recombinase
MSNCIIYVRTNYREVSDRKQSIVGQLKQCREYARENGMTVVGEFQDIGSANAPLVARDGLLDALTTLKKGDALLVAEADKLTRNSAEHFGFRKHLQKRGCKLIVVTAISGDEQAFMDAIMTKVNEYFSHSEED